MRPAVTDETEPKHEWDFSSFPGIEVADNRSDPVSEAVASDDDTDGNFYGVA